MTTDVRALQSLLVEITELGAEAEDHGINKMPSFDPLIEKARGLGVDIQSPVTLDDLRDAVESACEAARPSGHETESGMNPLAAQKIFGNETGIPGDGP